VSPGHTCDMPRRPPSTRGAHEMAPKTSPETLLVATVSEKHKDRGVPGHTCDIPGDRHPRGAYDMAPKTSPRHFWHLLSLRSIRIGVSPGAHLRHPRETVIHAGALSRNGPKDIPRDTTGSYCL